MESFTRFTEKAIKVIMLSQEEARRLGHNFIGTELILLGLIGEGTGTAAKTLKSVGINLTDARVEVENIIGRGSGFTAIEMPFTPRAKRVLELSWDEAYQLGHNYIGTEHLLLGLIREGDGIAARVLEDMGVKDFTKIRSHVIRLLYESGAAVPPKPTKVTFVKLPVLSLCLDSTIYISGPMTGLPEFNFPAFMEAEKYLTSHGYQVRNPATLHPDTSHKNSDYMRDDLMAIIKDCQGIFMLPGWWRSPGAQIELDVALKLALPVFFHEGC